MTSARSAEGWVGGVRAVLELLEQAPESALEVRLARRAQDGVSRRLTRAARAAGVKITTSSRRALDELLPGTNHQGVAARRSPVGYAELSELLAGDPPSLVVVLDGVTDPGNLGAILRSAWAFGAGAVVVGRHRSAGMTATAVKAAAGAAEHVPVCRVANTARALEQLKQHGYWVWGAAGEAARSLGELDFAGRMAVVLGAEGRGLRPGVRSVCDGLFRVPMRSDAGSLNVSVAAGVILARAWETSIGVLVEAAEGKESSGSEGGDSS